MPPSDRRPERWLSADCFADVADNLRMVADGIKGKPESSAMILDNRTLLFSTGSGEWAGFDGVKRKRGTDIYI